jgi:arginine deiminase
MTTSDRPVHVFNEVDPLKEVLVWGEPGCEALLAQLLPKSKSLFLTYYEVPEARAEFRRMQVLIENEGVAVVRARDAYVRVLSRQLIPDLPKTVQELEAKFLKRADEYFEAHQSEKGEELKSSGLSISAKEVHQQVSRDIKSILNEDVQHYGEENAIKLNHQLSFSYELPICNIFYGRDQSNTLGDRILLSRMRWDVRKPEIQIYKQVLDELGCGKYVVEIDKGFIEGGDSIILGDTCYIGVGARTTLNGAKSVCRLIGDRLAEHGIQIVAVVNERHEREAASPSNPTTEHMQAMHLDMFWVPLSAHLALAGGEMDNRRALCLTSQNGEIKTEDLGGFRNLLSDQGIQIIEVTPQEQRDYATNLLNFGNRKVLVALSKNERVNGELEKRGFKVITAELTKLVGGYGAAHCLTAPILR